MARGSSNGSPTFIRVDSGFWHVRWFCFDSSSAATLISCAQSVDLGTISSLADAPLLARVITSSLLNQDVMQCGEMQEELVWCSYLREAGNFCI
jgi:hypothetical protein